MTAVPRLRPTGPSVDFLADLSGHGDATAVVDDERSVSYAELDRMVAAAAERLGTTRRLVLLTAANRLDALVWYLGALRGGHVVLLTGDAHVDHLVDVHDPDVTLRRRDGALALDERRPDSAHDLHPELALLLSTSGSTGSPKLVRLSHANLSSNATAIASYLGLGPDDRTITSLPMQYCYGLSVIHSHLSVGAGIVMTSTSVVDPCFWAAVERHGVTNFAGVPHTFELLDRTRFVQRPPAGIRFVTQAGGRMDPERVRRYAALGAARGWELFVMYGQTEATARMAYLPPELATTRPEAVGLPIPGGTFRLQPFDGAAPGEGEVVYTGPNVMMGYAEGPVDLARGRDLDELRTGDVGRIAADGLLEIVGRRRDIIKPFGLRIDLGRIDQLLADSGLDARCAGDDDGVAVGVVGPHDCDEVEALLRRATSLPAGAVVVSRIAELPRLDTGKLDRRTLLRVVRADAHQHPHPPAHVGSVASLMAAVLGREHVGEDDSFVSLGGDSLSYVEMSVALEERIGRLPDGWHLLPVSALESATGRRRRVAHIETNVVLRAVAICLIVGNHAGLFLVGGGAHVLFAAAGYNFARFQLASGTWWRSIVRFALPSMLWIGAVAAVSDDFDLAHATLLHGWVGGRGRWAYWFVEVLVQVLVALALLLAIPAVRRFERRHRFAFPGLLLAGSLLVRFDVVDAGDHHRPFFRPHEIVWMFLLGWMASQADSTARRVGVSLITVAAVPGFFDDPLREAVLLGGLLLLLWVPTIPVIRPAHRLVGVVAAASLYTYLTHVQVHHLVSDRSPAAGLLLSLAVGYGMWRVVDPVVRTAGRQVPAPWRPAPAANREAPSRVSPERTGTRPSLVSLASASRSGSPHCS